MVEYISQGLHDAAKEAAVLLYSPGTDTFLEDLTRNAEESHELGSFKVLSDGAVIEKRNEIISMNFPR